MMEKNINMEELEQMRQQIKELKEQVNQKGKLNEKLVIKSIQSKMRRVQITIFKLAVLVLLATPLWIWIKYDMNLSWALTIFTILMMIGSVIADYLINRIDVGTMGGDLMETSKRLIQMKKNRSTQQKFSFIFLLPAWLFWLGYEMYQSRFAEFEPKVAVAMLMPIVVGAIIGGAIGLSIYHRWQRANDEMIEQIEDLKKETEEPTY